jgi:hypothetical protein
MMAFDEAMRRDVLSFKGVDVERQAWVEPRGNKGQAKALRQQYSWRSKADECHPL